MHAENGPAIDVLVEQLLAPGKTDPYYHGIARAWQMEEEATHRAIMLADLTGAPLYVVHVSAKQAVAQLAAARDKGQNVFGETCPQYLYLSLEEQLGAPARSGAFEGAKWVCSTPLRSRAEGHQDADVAGAAHQRPADGVHRPLPVLHEGPEGARASATSARSRTASARSSTGWTCCTRASSTARSRCERWVELTSTTPARMFGLYGQQGRHPARRRRRHRGLRPETGTPRSGSSKTHHMNMDYSAWEGFEIDGHVDTVLSRGHGRRSTSSGYVGRQGPRPVPEARPVSQYLS